MSDKKKLFITHDKSKSITEKHLHPDYSIIDIPDKNFTAIGDEACCACSICQKAIKLISNTNTDKTHTSELAYKEHLIHRRFTWLLSELGRHSFTHEILIPTPEIVFFRNCRPHFLIESSHHSLKYITSGDKLRLTEILKNYTKIVRNRKKEEKPGVKTLENYGKEICILRYTLNHKGNENKILDEAPEYENGPMRILSEKEFFDFMYERPGSNVWKNIVYIQTIVKCKTGIGNIITIHYKTLKPMNINDLQSSIDHKNDDKLMYSNPNNYCELLCKRIDALLHFYSDLEILNMKAEFTQDDLGKIWLTYANEIYVGHVDMPKPKSNKISKYTYEDMVAINEDLEKKVNKCTGKMKYEEYSSQMMDIYNNIKEKTQVDRVLSAKPICYKDLELMQSLETKHVWDRSGSISRKASKKRKKEQGFDPRNSGRTKKRFELIKSHSNNYDFFPTNYVQRKVWIFTSCSASPENKMKSKRSGVLH
ncbi:hypothetical protein SteCoe_21362 [Stentor coeruleus]|uniref:Uncharacterized protein n=1 Tax=Stentor coeruleus TaxID=5963 RepID=A0A1R2BPR3_9CILI|nr:hypothetical protein SteCoe_21362 [Stentor coeruleus]